MKKFLSLILALMLMAISLYAAPMAFAKEQAKNDVSPVIVVPGVGSSAIYSNPNTEDQSSALDLDSSFADTFKNTYIWRDLWRIARGKDVDPQIFINKLSDLTSSMRGLNCDNDGKSVGNIGIDCYWEDSLANHTDYLDTRSTAEPAVCKVICDNVGAENVWLYNYDFRSDVIADADKLSEFIDGVKKQSGKKQVTLVSASLGTSVVSAYIDRHSDKDDINRTVFLDGAFQGTSMGKLFKKDMVVNSTLIFDYLRLLTENYIYTEKMDYAPIEKLLTRFGKLSNNFINYIALLSNKDNIDDLYVKVVLPLVGNIPSLWECIPYDDFDESVNAITKLGYLQKDSGLYKTITEYHAIQGRLENNIKALQKKGVDVAIVCGYGLPQIPFTSVANNQSDMMIDTCYASFGATTGKAGEKVKGATSPDGLINSSSCKFEGVTYFVRGVQHMEFIYGTDVNKFVGYLATTNNNIDVKTSEKNNYSGFMAIDSNYKMSIVK